MIQYRALLEAELSPSLFDAFVRRQVVSQCWRKRGGVWRIEYDPFVDDWNKADYRALLSGLKRTLAGQGAVYGAFDGHLLKGFVSIEGTKLGSRAQYMDPVSYTHLDVYKRQTQASASSCSQKWGMAISGVWPMHSMAVGCFILLRSFFFS